MLFNTKNIFISVMLLTFSFSGLAMREKDETEPLTEHEIFRCIEILEKHIIFGVKGYYLKIGVWNNFDEFDYSRSLLPSLKKYLNGRKFFKGYIGAKKNIADFVRRINEKGVKSVYLPDIKEFAKLLNPKCVLDSAGAVCNIDALSDKDIIEHLTFGAWLLVRKKKAWHRAKRPLIEKIPSLASIGVQIRCGEVVSGSSRRAEGAIPISVVDEVVRTVVTRLRSKSHKKSGGFSRAEIDPEVYDDIDAIREMLYGVDSSLDIPQLEGFSL